MRARTLIGPGVVVAMALAIGCGGSGGGRSARNQGRATIRVTWPTAAARLIPTSSQSLVVTVAKGGVTVGTLTLKRPQAGGTLTSLPYGALNVTVKAYASTDGTGVAQALGVGTMTVTEDVPGTVAVNMDSTVASLTLTSNLTTIARGATATLTAAAKDSSGAIVPLATGSASETLGWSVTPASTAGVTGTGATVTLTGLANGDASITASLKVKDTGETVTSPALTVHVADPVTAAGLPTGGYPVSGHDYGGSGATSAPTAAGTIGDTISAGSAATRAVVGPDGTLYVAGNGVLLAKGAANWTLSGGGSASGLLLTGAGVLLVGRSTGLEARDAATQRLAWTGAATSAPAVGRDGTVFAFDAANLYAYNGSNGTVLWTRSVALADRLAIGDDGTVYGHKGATITAFDPATGTTKWSVTPFTNDTAGSSPVVVGDTVYVKTGKNNTSSIARSESAPLGESEPDSPPEGRFISGGTATTTGGLISGSTSGGTTKYYYTHVNVTALKVTDGSQRWTYAFPVPSNTYTLIVPSLTTVGGPVAVQNGRILAQWSSYLRMLNTSGSFVWNSSLTTTGSPTFAGDGTSYVYDSNNHLLAFNPDGTSHFSASLGTLGSNDPIVADDGTVYVGTGAGTVIQVH